ncbi:hypothetical protein NC652_010310 [Populus alba x Populus x berolinensis]|nr:hypothetical protein NC652_010310 [Populus alba x Populus x berolinensis]
MACFRVSDKEDVSSPCGQLSLAFNKSFAIVVVVWVCSEISVGVPWLLWGCSTAWWLDWSLTWTIWVGQQWVAPVLWVVAWLWLLIWGG